MFDSVWKATGAIFSKDFKVIKSQGFSTLLLFLFLLALGLLYGLMYQNVFDQNIHWTPLPVFIFDETGSSEPGFAEDLLSPDRFPFIELHKAFSSLDFEEGLANQKNAVGLLIKEEEGQTKIYWRSVGEKSIEKNILFQAIEKGVEEALWHTRTYAILGPRAADFMTEWEILAARPLIREVPREDIRVLSSLEYYLISLFTGFCILFTTEFVRDREQRLIARSFTAGIRKSTLYWSNFLSNFVLVFAVALVYFTIVFGIFLRIPVLLGPFFGAVIVQAMVVSAFQSLLGGVCKNRKVELVISLLALFTMLYLGGAFFPVEVMALERIAEFMPNFQLFKLYEGLVLGHPGLDATRLGILFAQSAVMALVGWFVFKKSEVL